MNTFIGIVFMTLVTGGLWFLALRPNATDTELQSTENQSDD